MCFFTGYIHDVELCTQNTTHVRVNLNYLTILVIFTFSFSLARLPSWLLLRKPMKETFLRTQLARAVWTRGYHATSLPAPAKET